MRIGLPSLLFCIFLVLKLTGHIAWSWWWITCPLWIGFAIFVVGFLMAFAIAIIGAGAFSRRW